MYWKRITRAVAASRLSFYLPRFIQYTNNTYCVHIRPPCGARRLDDAGRARLLVDYSARMRRISTMSAALGGAPHSRLGLIVFPTRSKKVVMLHNARQRTLSSPV